MKKLVSTITLAAGLLLAGAGPAAAHASGVSHQESCSEGTTKTVVSFDNDDSHTATVAYRWGAEPASSAALPAKAGGTNGKVALAAHDAGTIAWHVTWSDGYRQPSQGDSTLTIASIGGCQTTTTTKPATTTTTLIVLLPTTTTTGAAATTTTAAQATTTSAAPTTTTTVVAATTTTVSAQVLGVQEEQLPKTGGAPLGLLLMASIVIGSGLAAHRLGRTKSTG